MKSLTLDSPVREARKALRLTQAQLASRCNVERQVVIRNEQAQFPTPSPTLLSYFDAHWENYDNADFMDAYYEFQLDKRLANFGILPPMFPKDYFNEYLYSAQDTYDLGVEGLMSPLRYWLPKTVPVYALSKYLCIQQSVLYTFESGDFNLGAVPGQIVDALRASGYSNECLKDLSIGFNHYKNSLRLRSERGWKS